MHFPRRLRKITPTLSEHAKTMTDLRDKDRVIDSLLATADELVEELRESLAQASAEARRSATGEDDDGG